MFREATAMNVRQNFGELLNSVHYRHDSVVITKAGKPFAALVDIELFQKIHTLKMEFEKLSNELSSAYRDVDTSIAQAEIQAALKAARVKRA